MSDRTITTKGIELIVRLFFCRNEKPRIVLVETALRLGVEWLLNSKGVLSISDHTQISHAVRVARICVSAVDYAVFEVLNILLVLVQFYMGKQLNLFF